MSGRRGRVAALRGSSQPRRDRPSLANAPFADVDQLSKRIGPASHNEAEYKALIEGLELAHAHRVRHLRVYMDSELVVEQMNDRSAVRKTELRELHEVAMGLAARFKSIRILWVPRELNAEADRLVRDALGVVG